MTVARESVSRRLPAQERRLLLLRAAGPLFGERGFAGTRLDDVAAAAGVTKPIVYRHFDSKKALYLALLDKHEEDLPGFFENVSELPPEQQLRAIAEGWLDYMRKNRHSGLMLFRDSGGDDEIRAVREGVSERAVEVLAGFIAERAGPGLPAEQVEPAAAFLTRGLAELALWWIDRPEVPKDVIADVVLRMSAPVLVPSR